MLFYKETNFKETPIGRIPKDWSIVKLNEIIKNIKFSIVDGPFGTQLHSSEYVDKGVPLVRVNNINKDGSFNFNDLVYITEEKFEKLKRSAVYPGDVLLAKTGATIGKVCIFPKKLQKGLIASSCAKISADEKKVNILYIFYFLLSHLGYNQILALATGSTRPTINLQPIGEIKIIKSENIEEQQKIAEILSTVDEAIQKTNEIIAKTERLKRGLIQKLFTKGIGHKELREMEIGRIPKEWKVVRLRDVGVFQYGITTCAVDEDTGVRLLRITDITDEGIKWNYVPFCKITEAEFKKYRLKLNDILFARIGATTGKTCYISQPINGVFGSYLIRFNPIKELNTLFLYFYTQSSIYWNQINRIKEGQLKKGLNIKTLGSLLLPIARLLEQQKIAEILSTVDKKLEIERKEKAKLERIKQGLMDLLLTGKVRVKVA